MACDDVCTQKSTEDINFISFDPKFANQMFSNLNTYETLLCLQAAKLVKFRLIYKRIDANNCIFWLTKIYCNCKALLISFYDVF